MSTKHTPGPWKAGHYSSIVGLPVMAQPDTAKNTLVVAGVRGEREVAEANARLIAAAPCLLEALKYAEEQLQAYRTTRVGVHHAAIVKCRAAITKATGAAP